MKWNEILQHKILNFKFLFPDLKMSDNGLYTCQARSPSGQAVWSASLSVADPNDPSAQFKAMPYFSQFPASPSMPVFVNATSTSITVAWDKPHRIGGSPLKGYQVLKRHQQLYFFFNLHVQNDSLIEFVKYVVFIIKSLQNIGTITYTVKLQNEISFFSVGLLHACYSFTLAHHPRCQTRGLHFD